VPGGSAQKAGLKLGDVIMKANGKPVADMNDLHLQIAGMPPGVTVMLTVLRDGRPIEVPVKMTDVSGKPDSSAPAVAPERSVQERVRP
jgi:S1-C subfamily serine protease